ncbi:MAG TPA: metalloregulator ArsR/SmtB family transcription factor [Jatrophihabitans sp.]|jgi:DNA-binding transcriptional ArsR family regulator|uniref:ArsR/SmtB family transcription factor n=1 Tax=Jatrophihabitans sp. TaxID=1932789 RepID=UPI002EF49AE4
MSNHSAAEAALDALGDPMRRRLLELLHAGPRPVGELAAELPIGRPAVSKHLRVLEGAGLVRHRSEGTRNLYALAPEGLTDVQQWLVGVWDTALAAFASYVAAASTPPADSTPPEQHATRPARHPSGPGGLRT